jgi:hypothetical protein
LNSNSFPIGFSAGGTNMLFEDNFIQNGDDCLTVGNGAKDIVFRFVTRISPSMPGLITIKEIPTVRVDMDFQSAHWVKGVR